MLKQESKKGEKMSISDNEFDEERVELINRHVNEAGRKLIDHLYLQPKLS